MSEIPPEKREEMQEAIQVLASIMVVTDNIWYQHHIENPFNDGRDVYVRVGISDDEPEWW